MCNHQDSDFTATSKLTATGIHSHNEMEYPQLAVQLLPLDEGLNHMRLPFAYKLHILLGDMEANRCEHIISWVENGIAFQIHDRQQFEDRIQPRYFRQSKIASFIRQCYMYGFSKVEGGRSHGSYVHPDFCKNDQAKSLTIQRQSSIRSRRQYHFNSANLISSLSSTTTGRGVKLPPIEESPTNVSSNDVIISRGASPVSSMIATSLPLDSVLDGRLPVSDSSLHCWLDGRQHDSFNEDDSTTSLDESLFASLYDALFEPRPIELMLLCSSHQNLSKSPPPW